MSRGRARPPSGAVERAGALAGAAIVGLSLASCAGPDTGSLEQREVSAIAGGEPSTSADDAVIFVRTPATPPYLEMTCTGTLVAPDIVLTALACVSLFSSGGSGCEPTGSHVEPDKGGGWLTPATASDIEVHLGPAAAQTEPAAYGSQVFGTGSIDYCIDNIALLTLDRALPIVPFPLRLRRQVWVGETVSVIGFGEGTHANSPFLRFRRDGLDVLVVDPDSSLGEPTTAAPRTFLTGPGPCKGDNGGPAVDTETGAVVGVYSRGDVASACESAGQTRVFTKVAPYEGLIRDAFAAQGEEPIEEAGSATSEAPKARNSGCSFCVSNQVASDVSLHLLVIAGLLARRRRRSHNRPPACAAPA